MTQETKNWMHGLAATAIAGAAGAIDSGLALIIIDPDHFNLGSGLRRTLLTIAVLGCLTGAKCAFAYLKQSPVPPEPTTTPAANSAAAGK